MARRSRSRAKLRRRFPKVLAEVCGHRIRTLRQLILELLGPSLRLAPCNCKVPGEGHFKYCASCDPSTYLLRDDDHADYWTLLECSYGVVSNTAPRVESFALENRWSQLQIIERATELQFREAKRPLNVICFGYRQPEPNKTGMGSISAPYGLECASSNSVTRLLNSQAWMILLSRVGDMFMLHLLLYTSVFYPLPNNSYLQVTGVPISNLVSCYQPRGFVQSGHSGITHCCSVNPAATGMCKISGLQTESEWAHVKNECQLKACSHCAEMDRSVLLTESIGFGLNLSNSSRNRTGKNGYERVCGGDKKRPYISDHWTAGYKTMKDNSEKRLFKPERLFVDSYAVCRSGDYYWDGCSAGTTALDYQHIGHIIAGVNVFYRPLREHSEGGSVHLPCSYSLLSNKSQSHFLSSLESDLAYDPVLYPGWKGEEHVTENCSNLENFSLEALQSSSYNVAENGGQPKKRRRPFRWQRCKRYKARKRDCKVKDDTPKDSSLSQQLQSASDFDHPLGNYKKLKQPGATFQCFSPKDSLEQLKVARKFSDKILVSDQMFCLESDLLSLNGNEDNGQNLDVLRHVKRTRLSSSKDKHMSQAGTQKVDHTLVSISKNQTHGHCKNQRHSKFTINTANPLAFDKNANHRQESMLECHRRKMSCRCLCWLMSHMKHMDEVNTLINRRTLFYNSRYLQRSGFPKNHILNVIKPSNIGAKKLFVLIFGLHHSCLCHTCSCHEDLTGGAKVFESLSKVSPVLSLLKVLIRNAQHCDFARLLERHSPIQMKHPREVLSMPSSQTTSSLYSEGYSEGYGTQDKETWSVLLGTAQKDNNHIDVDLTSTSQVLPGYNGPYVENNCMIHCNNLDECSLFQHTDNLGSQHARLADCFDEETYARGSSPKDSRVHKLAGKRLSKNHFMSGANENTNGQDSEHPNKLSGSCKAPSKNLENKLITSCTSHNEIVSFIWAVCRRIIPEALLGSKHNWRALRSNIAKFVKLRRFENFTLQQCLYKLKTSHYPWLNGASLSCEHCLCLNSPNWSYPYDCLENEGSTYHCSTDKNKGGNPSHKAFLQQRMLSNWIFWLFSSLIVPLIQAHFYVTESENGRQNVYYYRKNAWAKILKGVVKNLNRTNYRRLSAVSLASILQRRSLGFSRVRFLPKATGVRPITNLGAPSTMWLQLEKNPVQTAKMGNRNRLGNNLLILERNDRTKFQKQKGCIERNTQTYVDNLRNKYNLDAKKGDRFASFSFHAPTSDKLKKEGRNLTGSDSQVKLSFRSINSCLSDSHYCLKLEQEDFPEALGCSVFDYNDIYQKFVPFVLSLKDYFIGLPKLYIAVCDVAKAFDTINHNKLLDVIQSILQKEEYLVQRYTKVSCTAKSVRVSHERCSVPKKGAGFVNSSASLSARHSQSIFIDQAFHTRIKREELLALITEHVKRNILQIGPHFYIQKVGIPQGSVLSSLLCSFYFGHLDRNRILPLLGHNQKKHIIDSPEKIFTKHRFNGDLSCSKVPSQARGGGEVGTCFFQEKDKISGISIRHSQSMGIAKETLNIGSTTCSRDILEYCSCHNLNENEIRHCLSVSPKSMLLRLIDDSLFISTSKKEAFSFIAAMHRGFEDYNCYTNKQKTSLNFDMELEGKNLEKNIYETKDGSCFMRWSGLLINCHTLEIQADYTRYCGTHISSTVTVSRQKNPGYYLVVKLCQFMRPKCHPIFYDSNINSPTTVRLNAYQAFLLCAMKFHVYVCSMPSVGACSPRYAFQAIMKTTRYMYKLVKQKMHSIGLKSSSHPIFSLQQKEMEWLGFSAYHKVLWRKQSRYKPLLSFLETKLHSPKYQDLIASLDLQFAVDDCRSSMFWQIQY